MHWIFWVALPLPLLSLVTLLFALTRKDAQPKQRALVAGASAAAFVLGIVLLIFLWK